MSHFADKLRNAIALENLDHDRPLLPGRAAAVLVLFREGKGDPELLLTRRTHIVETHKGQIAFPGGAVDPEDYEDQGVLTAALRETEEEVGISRTEVELIGKLPDLWTPSQFLITPVVGVLRRPDVELKPNPHEIDIVFWVPISVFDAPEIYSLEMFPVGEARYPVHVYQVDEHRVWGATAAVIKNLLDRLRLCEDR